mgnify:CR=1 FL=1
MVLNKILQFIGRNFKELIQFLTSTNFSKSILVVIALSIPLSIGIWTGQIEIGLALCFGAFWCFPSDVIGSQKHKIFGILFSSVLIMVVSFVGAYVHYVYWLSLLILGVISFAIAFLSIYGFRASLISFSGLLALVLSFAHTPAKLEPYEYALLVGAGGVWYMTLSVIWYKINPKGQLEEILYDTIGRTSDLIFMRGKLIDHSNDRSQLQSNLFLIQSDLTEKHEILREILILSRKSSGRSTYMGKRLLVLVQLVDMLETAVANPIDYDKMDVLFKTYPEYMLLFQNSNFEMAKQLKEIAELGNTPSKIPSNEKLVENFKRLQFKVSSLSSSNNIEKYEVYLMFKNFLDYQEKQIDKLKRLKWLLSNHVVTPDQFIDKEDSKIFLIHQNYDPKLLVRNFSFRSTIFRHSLRLSTTLIIGFVVGNIFSFQNQYWILLTIIVIMRPNYGLTKTRSKDRIIGTLIGGAIATVIVYFVHDVYVYGILALSTLVIALSMLQKNYKASAIYVTLSIIFVYGIIRPDVFMVIQYRILDTIVGAGLSYLGILWLWPSWGFLEIKQDVTKSVVANRIYLGHITKFYNEKGNVPTSYRLARKNAFFETSNLSSAFQRMTQEPHSKQKNLNIIYELVELNHNFLSSLATLSTYMQHQTTTDASATFNTVISRIDDNLSMVLSSLDNSQESQKKRQIDAIMSYENQLPKFESKNLELGVDGTTGIKRNHQEEQLIWEQLRWLYSLSANMMKLTSSL